jgi:hypothetical protein
MSEKTTLTIRGATPRNTAELHLEVDGEGDVNLMCNGRLMAWVQPDGQMFIKHILGVSLSVFAEVDLGSSNQARESHE